MDCGDELLWPRQESPIINIVAAVCARVARSLARGGEGHAAAQLLLLCGHLISVFLTAGSGGEQNSVPYLNNIIIAKYRTWPPSLLHNSAVFA